MNINSTNMWAKTGMAGVERWHPLILHLLDVAACADAILAREPQSTRDQLAVVLGLDWVRARPWLLLLIACHDLGKGCPGFQCKWKSADLPGWFKTRRLHNAEEALDKTGWLPRLPLATAHHAFDAVFGFAPHLLQQAVVDTLDSIDQPAILLIEAPMGEGKTEAALYAHLELQRRRGHRGLYVTVPTKATGNTMFGRVLKFLHSQRWKPASATAKSWGWGFYRSHPYLDDCQSVRLRFAVGAATGVNCLRCFVRSAIWSGNRISSRTRQFAGGAHV